MLCTFLTGLERGKRDGTGCSLPRQRSRTRRTERAWARSPRIRRPDLKGNSGLEMEGVHIDSSRGGYYLTKVKAF